MDCRRGDRRIGPHHRGRGARDPGSGERRHHVEQWIRDAGDGPTRGRRGGRQHRRWAPQCTRDRPGADSTGAGGRVGRHGVVTWAASPSQLDRTRDRGNAPACPGNDRHLGPCGERRARAAESILNHARRDRPCLQPLPVGFRDQEPSQRWWSACPRERAPVRSGLRSFVAAERTGGAVDPTVGRALEALGYDRDFAEVPALGATLRVPPVPAPGWWLVELDETTRSVKCRRGSISILVRRPRRSWPIGPRAASRQRRGPAHWSVWAGTWLCRVLPPMADGRSGSP